MQLNVVCSCDERSMYAPGMIMASVGMSSPPILVGSAIVALVIPDFTLVSPSQEPFHLPASWPDIAARRCFRGHV